MKHLTTILSSLFLVACNTSPTIIPDTTKDNVVMKKLQWEIENQYQISTNWGWVLWYLPVVFLIVVWAYNQYLRSCEDKLKCYEMEKKMEDDCEGKKVKSQEGK
jgi:nucleoside recognition membrane protein YjiH